MSMLKKTLKAVSVKDKADPKTPVVPLHFYVLEGMCRKCNCRENSLVIYDFKVNASDFEQSIFKTQCIVCGHKDMHYSSSVQRSSGTEED